jgi:glycosyltransferase involved in cell wall biosynthesis
MACGTTVITYNTGGSPESISIETGIVVEKGNIKGLHNSIEKIINSRDFYSSAQCQDQALRKFSARSGLEII